MLGMSCCDDVWSDVPLPARWTAAGKSPSLPPPGVREPYIDLSFVDIKEDLEVVQRGKESTNIVERAR